ncbi:MAG: hypothetical protein A3J83_03600 [Elusimicrobia bacterium RIFOXYA2_FULL_40_6]|nr:MAG: hypothetical protein A3J83_03600 [Elusimicrobia bacterium RIFOXYA2_FULL_40_6]
METLDNQELDNEVKEKLLRAKSLYDSTGSITAVAKEMNIAIWQARKYLSKGHWLGLFKFDRFYKNNRVPPKSRTSFLNNLDPAYINKVIDSYTRHGKLVLAAQELNIKVFHVRDILLLADKQGMINYPDLKKKIHPTRFNNLLKEHTLEEIVDSFLRTRSVLNTAKEFNIYRDAIEWALDMAEEKGIFNYSKFKEKNRPSLQNIFNRFTIEELVGAYIEFHSFKKMAKKLNIPPSHARQIVLLADRDKIIDYAKLKTEHKSYHANMKLKRILKRIPIQNVVASYKRDKSFYYLSKEFKISIHYCKKILQKAKKEGLLKRLRKRC